MASNITNRTENGEPMMQGDNGNIDVGQANNQVRHESALENRAKLCDLLDKYVETIEQIVNEGVTEQRIREEAIQPFRESTTALKYEITQLHNFAIIPDETFLTLKQHNMVEKHRLDRNLVYAQQLHDAFGQLQKATKATSPARAQHIITTTFGAIENICQKTNCTPANWHIKVDEILAINDALITENNDLRDNVTHLQEIVHSGSTGGGMQGSQPRESPQNITFTQWSDDRGINDMFQKEQHQGIQSSTQSTPIQSEYGQQIGQRTAQIPANPSNLIIKAQILPKLLPFSGQGKSLDDFMVDFDGKFPPSVFSEAERRNRFVDLLKDEAYRRYRALDSHEQRGNVEYIVSKLKTMLRRDDQINGHAAQLELDRLVLRPDQLVEFCDRLEMLTKQIFPSMPGAELSYWRASQLYKRITHWNNAVDALRILEQTPREFVYDEMRKFVFQIDRIRKYRNAFNNVARNDTPSRRQQNSDSTLAQPHSQPRRNEPTPQRNGPGTTQNMKCHECGQEGHFRRNCPRTQNNPTRSAPFANYHQTAAGDSRRQPLQNHPSQTGNRYTNNPRGPPQGRQPTVHNVEPDYHRQSSPTSTTSHSHPDDNRLFSLAGINTAAEVNSLVFNEMMYFGAKSLFEVTIGDLRGTALVDSGAQPSILSFSTYRYIIKSIPEPRRFLKLLDPLPGEPIKITNASGEIMPVKAQVLIKLKLAANQKEAQIVFHITNDPEDAPIRDLLIGTNAFAALGIRLSFDHPKANNVQEVRKEEENVNEIQEEPQTVHVAKRVELWPSEALWIPLKMENFEAFKKKEAVIVAEKDAFGRDTFTQAVCKFDDTGESRILISNNSAQRMVLRKGQVIGRAVEAQNVFSVSPISLPEVMTCIAQGEQGQVPPSRNRGEQLIEMVKEQSKEAVPDEIAEILKDFSEYFAIDDSELRQTQLVVHDIETGDTQPIRQKLRPVPVGVRKQFREIIQSLLERKVIEASSSPWASPIVLVVKKDGSLRLCIDYRELNKVIRLDAYPLPSIEGILQSLNGKKYFSTLDLASGFWQISLTDSAKPKTAFLTSEGLFQFKVLPFGLSTSPASFQRLMHKVLAPLMDESQEVHVYVDDLLVATDSRERHFEVLRQVMTALSQANLAVKLSKCLFLRKSVPYLGHQIDGEGIHTDPQKVEIIRNASRPKNIKELRSFLGLASYYRKFVLKFATIASPLFALTKQSEKFEWNHRCQEAFDRLKDVLCSAPVLCQPDVEGALDGSNPFIIYTDAANTGVGAVLSQKGPDENLHPVWFASKALTKAEAKYHVTDLEALGVVFALKKFQSLIYNMRGTVVRTDHLPLLCLFKKAISARMLRWSLLIQHFNVKIEYVKGQANIVADALSRNLVTPDLETVETTVCDDLASRVVGAVQVDEKWLVELRKDKLYTALIEHLENKEKGDESTKTTEKQSSGLVVNLYEGHRKLQAQDFEIEDEFLWLIIEQNRPRRVVPLSRRRELFEEAHQGVYAGHFNPKKILKLLKNNFYWETMNKDIHLWHKNCVRCFISNINDTLIPPLKPIITSRPFEIVGTDVMELGLSANGNRYVLVLIDHFTKWVGGYAIPDKSAETVANVIATRWLAEGRWPQSFLSDQGSEFLNSTLEALRTLTKIEWKVTKGYLPRENGITERFNRTLQRSLRKILAQPADWDVVLPFVIHAYNCSAHESTGDSPYFLLYGTDPILPFVDAPPTRPRHQLVDYSQYKESLIDAIREAHEIAKDRNAKEIERAKQYYDRRHRVDQKKYPRIGDRVFLKLSPSKTNCRHPKLVYNVKGPYRIIETSENSALITLINKNEEPLRVQFDSLIIIPQGLDTPEINPKRKRKVVQRTLPATTKTVIVASCNISICRIINVLVTNEQPVHPSHTCIGSTDGASTVTMCPLSCASVDALAKTFHYDCPTNMKEFGIKTIAQAAKSLDILQNTSIHPTSKGNMLQDTISLSINATTWSRAIHFCRTNCRHLDIFLRVHEGKRFQLDPPLPFLDDRTLNEAIKLSKEPPRHRWLTDDLFLHPSIPLYSRWQQVILKQGTVQSYGSSLRAAAAIMQAAPHRNVTIMMPPTPEDKDLTESILHLHQCGQTNHSLVILTPGLIITSIGEWTKQLENLMTAFLKYTRDCRNKNVEPHVFLNRPQDDILKFGMSWNILGADLEKHTDNGNLSIEQLRTVTRHLSDELFSQNIKNSYNPRKADERMANGGYAQTRRPQQQNQPSRRIATSYQQGPHRHRFDPVHRRSSGFGGRGMSRGTPRQQEQRHRRQF